MKAATLPLIRKELETCTPKRVTELLLKVVRYKVENKEFLSYLLFDSADTESYIREIKDEISSQIQEINRFNPYLVKKGLRKILRLISKYCRYIGTKEAETELLVFFCDSVRKSGISVNSNKAVYNLYSRQIEKISKLIPFLHEDLQFEYKESLKDLAV